MTIQSRFTPEVMLSAPRRSPGVPNPKGNLILYTVMIIHAGVVKSGNMVSGLTQD
jgi:hypothetical protein